MQSIRCRIQLLDGTDVEQQFKKNDLGNIVYDFVCDHLRLVEKDYFGCSYVENDTKFWLRLDKKLSKQTKGDFVMNFEVKFYPLEVFRMKDQTARYLLFLQLRKDMFLKKLPVGFVSQVLLGALAAQSNSDGSGDQHIDGYSNGNVGTLSPQLNEELMDKIAEMHRHFNGLSQDEAIFNFIDNARLLALYGVHKHSAMNMEGKEVIIGVHARGLLIFVGTVVIRKIIWAKMIKIYYKKSKFFIRVRKDEHEVKDYNLTFKLNTVAEARNLWRLAMEHHTFFRLKESTDISIAWYRGGQYKSSYPGKTLQQTSTYDFIRTLPKDNDYKNNYKPTQLGTERGEELIAEVAKPLMLTLRMKGNVSRSTIGNNQFDPNNNLEPRDGNRSQMDVRSLASSMGVQSNNTAPTLPRNFQQPQTNNFWVNPGFESNFVPINPYDNAQSQTNVINYVAPGNNSFVAPGNNNFVEPGNNNFGAQQQTIVVRRVVENGGAGNAERFYNYEEGQGENPYDEIGSDLEQPSFDNSEEERILASAIRKVTNMDENYQVSKIEVYTNQHPYSDI